MTIFKLKNTYTIFMNYKQLISWHVIALAVFSFTYTESCLAADILVIDSMDRPSKNNLGGRNSVYQKPPSRALYMKSKHIGKGPENFGLKIRYDKKSEGGPHGAGGWCGFYTLLSTSTGFLDASEYNYLSFWVKGEKGGENFKVGIADERLEKLGDSMKSKIVTEYLPEGEITQQWQRAVIPVQEWYVDWKSLHAIAIAFESTAFVNLGGNGTVYIDDIAFLKDLPADMGNNFIIK